MKSRNQGPRTRTLIGAGLLVFAFVQLVSTSSNLNQGRSRTEQFPTQGSKEIQITQGGSYHLWYHYKTYFQGQRINHSSQFPNNISIRLTDSDGQNLELSQKNKQSWSIGNHAKKSLGHIDLPGNQTIVVTTDGGGGPGAILSFSRADIKGELWQALGGFAYALVSGLLGLPLLLWGLFARK